MGVRKFYDVTVGGVCVFTGSYQSVFKVYDCLCVVSNLLKSSYSFEFPAIAISFKPASSL